jgi:hypothetical protein
MGKRDITDVTSFGLIRCNWDLKQPFPCQNPAKEVQKCNCGVWRHGRRWSLATAWHVILNIPSSSQSILTSWVQAMSGAVERSLKASRFVRFQNGLSNQRGYGHHLKTLPFGWIYFWKFYTEDYAQFFVDFDKKESKLFLAVLFFLPDHYLAESLFQRCLWLGLLYMPKECISKINSRLYLWSGNS